MAKNDQCPWGDQWRSGYLANPQKKDKGYVADLVMWVHSKADAPNDFEVIVPYPHGRGCLAIKEVVIDRETFSELSKAENGD